MRKPTYRTPLRFLALLFIAAALILLLFQIIRNSGSAPVLAAGTTWGGVPVGGLTPTEAGSRVEEVYAAPVELRYRDYAIQVAPEDLGFNLNTAAMVEIGSRERHTGWWQQLWSNSTENQSTELQASVNGEVLRSYLEREIAARYDKPPEPSLPVAGTTNFTAGTPGWQLNVQESAVRVSSALMNGSARVVDLQVEEIPHQTADLRNLEIFLKQTISNSGFEGVAEVYLQDLAAEDLLHFATSGNADVPVDIAFSAASTIKIPVMVSVLRRTSEPTPDGVKDLLARMIELSENPPADELMQSVIDEVSAPLFVTSDMQEGLGLQNTFLAGYFYFGADLLRIYQTPANSRTDIDLDPDIYNQTTASDMGRLLTGIYKCAQGEESILTAAFPGEISPAECQYMLDILARNKIGVLSEAGVPDGTRVAHKHGWTEEADGYLHSVSDVGIVFSPGADFVFAVFLYDYNQLLFDPADELVAQLVQVMYNYNNPGAQETWLGEKILFP